MKPNNFLSPEETRKFFRQCGVLVFLLTAIAGGAYFTYQDVEGERLVVVSSESAGALKNLRIERAGTLFLAPRFTVKTSRALYRLEGSWVATIGDELILEARGNGWSYLCVADRSICARVVAVPSEE